jgi:membrane protease YdiL (CAAX protease family)
MNTIKPFNWKIFFTLLAAAAFGIVAILPYTLALQADALAKLELPLPMEIIIPIQVLQSIVMFGIAILIGLFLANRTGLGLPILEARLAGKSIGEQVKPILLPSILLGVIASVAIIALDTFIFQPALVAELGKAGEALNLRTAQPAAWKGLLASFYGGINEEILLRLFLFTLLAWVGKFISHTEEGRPTIAVLWTANIAAAVLFGLGHLPATALLIPLTPLVVARAILLNGLAGIAFGYLYWTRGLESAIVAHFSADIILHVLLAL